VHHDGRSVTRVDLGADTAIVDVVTAGDQTWALTGEGLVELGSGERIAVDGAGDRLFVGPDRLWLTNDRQARAHPRP
jgi:hypothetical protein